MDEEDGVSLFDCVNGRFSIGGTGEKGSISRF